MILLCLATCFGNPRCCHHVSKYLKLSYMLLYIYKTLKLLLLNLTYLMHPYQHLQVFITDVSFLFLVLYPRLCCDSTVNLCYLPFVQFLQDELPYRTVVRSGIDYCQYKACKQTEPSICFTI